MKSAKKISIMLIIALVFSTLAVFNVSAIPPTYNFTMPKLVIPVELEKVNPVEAWDDAGTFVLDINNEVLKEFGRWQGAEENDKPGTDRLQLTYYMKWDDTYIYIREDRFDTSYHFTYDHAREPWIGDGTLFFLAYDDGDPKFEKSYQPFWANKASDGKTHMAVRYWKDGQYSMFDEPEDIGNWKFAGIQNGDHYITELAIPWTDLLAYTPGMPKPSEGMKMRFTPVIPNVSTDDLFGEDWNQMNMHDRFGRDDADLEENSNPGELPANWAGLLLGAATYVVPVVAEDVPEAAPQDDAPAAPAATAPRTGDSAILLIFAVLMICAAPVAIFKTRKNHN